MNYIDIVTALALLQFLAFDILTGRARGKYKIKAPAVTGHDLFERTFRVQMNTLEQLIVFVPALWMAAKYWNPTWMALLGAIYLVGRVIYYVQYTDPTKNRTVGFALSFTPVFALAVLALLGAVMQGLK